ncbi:MAG TPA: isoprenylcysteine carboxylmethyltransferase family protein [Gaiellaceae bacterium]
MRATTLPALGARGGGWVVMQTVLIAAVVACAVAFSASWPAAVVAAGGLLLVLGVLLLGWAWRGLGSALTPYPAPRPDGRLAARGAYAHARHPMYGGVVLAAAGGAILCSSWPALVAASLLAPFFVLKSLREEAWLRERVDGYAEYAARTRARLFPFLF